MSFFRFRREGGAGEGKVKENCLGVGVFVGVFVGVRDGVVLPDLSLVAE